MDKKEFIIKGLSYRLHSTNLLDDMSFSVQEDEKLAILGINGSGKSLLLDGILGNIECTCEANSFLDDRQKYGPYGVLYDTFSSFPLLKVREIVSLLSIIFNHRVDQSLLKKFGVTDLLDKQFKVLSKGENKKLGIYAALFFEPKIVFMDEPLDGLDPNSRNRFWETISGISCTMIFTTHVWEEVRLYANKIMFVKDGKTLNQPASSDELLTKYCPYKGKIVISRENGQFSCLTSPDIGKEKQSYEYAYYYKSQEEKEELLRKFNNNRITNLSILPITLRDVYNYIIKQ
ncbi:hypothetical protein HMPREF1640_12920 [Prevotella sp. S7-1-8]|jgi:hypothetical protein|uniref:ABC transporter ATP-binding protein n=1 Tax=Hoylesella timonensis TaxID=386414 RepID=A0A2N6Q8A4_9BACT|nr:MULTISPECIES: ABC transporter ATP-binding protein [Prevotellaceae]KGF14624.1 hypothetical protein HMPREF1640_12920 [Prevotella sp. S7-1-8]MDD7596060.1 ABC transporter ATP-binding protein [Prevotellaceae bacterium]MDY5843771.1 ABC transporter ATP-binding protein [Prevotella sp.]PMC11142.1 ABC transporter ATP-binding protein [Hoylesella timonensis]